MKRRRLLATIGGGLSTGLSGCQRSSDDGRTTTTPAPEPSSLTIRVVNRDDATHDVTVRLAVSTPGEDRFDFFRIEDVEPGVSRTDGPRELPAGAYELRLEVPLGSPTIRWTGRECTEKLVVVRFVENGVELADRCPSEE